jgi:hypothetical protein
VQAAIRSDIRGDRGVTLYRSSRRIIRVFKGLSVNNRIALCLRVGALSVIAWMYIGGRPPAGAQHSSDQVVPTERVVTRTDEDQDIAISKLQEFKLNQENWNKQTGTDVAALNGSVSKFYGGLGVLMVLTTGAVGLQFKKRAA